MKPTEGRGPAPWDLPPKEPVVPASRGRGAAKSHSKPSKRLSDAARRAIADKRPERHTLALADCPRCGYLVLTGNVEAGRTVTLDIWVIPWAEAAIIDRYAPCTLWREYAKAQFMVWAGWNTSGALREHECGNRWWSRRSIYVEKAQGMICE